MQTRMNIEISRVRMRDQRGMLLKFKSAAGLGAVMMTRNRAARTPGNLIMKLDKGLVYEFVVDRSCSQVWIRIWIAQIGFGEVAMFAVQLRYDRIRVNLETPSGTAR